MRSAQGFTAIATLAAAWLLAPAALHAQDAKPGTQTDLWTKATGPNGTDWSKFMVDTSGASVTAFSLLGVPSDSVANVQNVRDVTLAVKGFGSNANGFGVSVTPARTAFTPMNLTSYATSSIDRLLGAVTIGYARGNTTISGADYGRQAVSLETNYFFRAADDPVVAAAVAIGDCARRGGLLGPAKPDKPAVGQPADGDNRARAPVEASKEVQDAYQQKSDTCRKAALDSMRWNRSQLSASFVTGWIQPESGSQGSHTLGRSAALAVTYGFDQVASLKQNSALDLTLRRSVNEPVLETLAQPTIQEKSSSLAVLRFTGGSKTFRALGEISNARTSQVTSTQRAFRQAAGVDYRLAENTWLNFRIGKQRTIDGSRDEVSSLVGLSYSPAQLLK